jgi:hypothetical protein
VVVPDTIRHEAGNENCSVPDVVVLSKYLPSEVAVHVPVTWRSPVTLPDRQPNPTIDMSS